MDSKGLKTKVALIAAIIILWSVLTFSQSRQNSGPKLPESRLPVEQIDNTVKGVTMEDLQAMKNALDAEIAKLKSTQAGLESRIQALETGQDR